MLDVILKQLAPKGYLRAAINLSNFLLVTGQEANGDPKGVSPDMAKALANELGIDLELVPFKRPGELADAISEDVWDIANIANEAERAKSITFSLPYTLIESTYLVRKSSNIQSLEDVDKKGVRIAVAERSAYDLWLAANIKKAILKRAKTIDESFSIFELNKYEVLAGLRPKLIDDLK
ncbi:transporter substrate-binding domain-containing protein, partial [Alphaproteobacteria bacterium]|nr:transporter substrate-binding domain-containing protein [Alphaproteobacteria bacterium]